MREYGGNERVVINECREELRERRGKKENEIG